MISVASVVFNLIKRHWIGSYQLPNVETCIKETEIVDIPRPKLVGIVTSVKGYMVEINDKYISYSSVRKLKIGDVVEYCQVGSNEGNTITIGRKLEAAPGNYGFSTIFEGDITYIDEDNIIVNPGLHKLDKKEVVLTYVPEIGDSVIVQRNENRLLLNPVFCKVIQSTVQKWDSYTGLVENKVPFKLDVCENGYIPRVGDKVACSLIPTSNKSKWRCVVLLKWMLRYNAGNSISISTTPFFTVTLGEHRLIEIDIKNNMMKQLVLENIKIMSYEYVRLEGNRNPLILPGLTVTVKFICTGKEVGHTNFTIEFRFNNSTTILRKISFYTCDPYLEDSSKGIKLALVDHRQGRGNSNLYTQYNLSRYEVPARLTAIYDEWKYNDRFDLMAKIQSEIPVLSEGLTRSNYEEYWHTLLFLEEMSEQRQLNELETVGYIRKQEDNNYYFIVDEKSAATTICVGDRAEFSLPWVENQNESQTVRVHAKMNNRLFFKFKDVYGVFHDNVSLFKIKFHKNRTISKRLHLTIDKLLYRKSNFKWLYPNNVQNKTTGGPKRNQFINNNVCWYNKSLNSEQKKVVLDIIFCRNNFKCPYLVFGPPGTGKTITVVELALQILEFSTNSRILIAAPSNSAVDIISSHLISYGVLRDDEFLRLVSYTYASQGRIPENLIKYSAVVNAAESEEIKMRRVTHPDDLRGPKIICGTLRALTLLTVLQIKYKFTHVIIDEAGQTTEPETLVPLSIVLADNYDPSIILVGDPYQLGPVIQCDIAKTYRLDESLMERLMSLPLYWSLKSSSTSNNEGTGTILTKNYRSDASLVKFISENFYKNTLEPMVKHSINSEILRKFKSTNFGTTEARIIFINANGKEEKSENYFQSFFNMEEIGTVVSILSELYGCGISEKDVGVITPYLLQAKEINDSLNNFKVVLPKVGTVEEFQGNEKGIIILTLVRTTMKSCKLSFISESKRANVALSRAQIANIIVGNYQTLMTSSLWSRLLRSPHVYKYNC